jgi:hypothetical protein
MLCVSGVLPEPCTPDSGAVVSPQLDGALPVRSRCMM